MDRESEGLSVSNQAAGPSGETPPPIFSQAQQTIVYGADGLRAGWSLLIFVLLLALLLFVALAVGYKLYPSVSPPPPGNPVSTGFMLLSESVPFLLILTATWVMSKIESRPNSVYGLGGKRKFAHFFAGVVWGVACLSLLVLMLWKAGLLVFERRLLSGVDIFRYGALWFVGFLFVGLQEEYLVRGYLQYTVARGMAGFYRWALKTPHSAALGFWTAAAFLSVLFGLAHGKNPGESPIGLLSAGLIGVVFCLSLWRTGSLWWAIGFHAAWDWAQSFFYGVADSGTMVEHHFWATHPAGKAILSGGVTGPEGSIFILAAVSVAALIILFTLPRTGGGYAANLPAHGDTGTQAADLASG